MAPEPNKAAFEDALAVVATTNTVTYLRNQLRAHPLVQYLADRFSLGEIERKLLDEVGQVDRTLQKTTIVVLLTMAMLNKLDQQPVRGNVTQALNKSEVRWAKDLLALYEPRNASTTEIVKLSSNFPRAVVGSYGQAVATNLETTTFSA